MVLIAHGWELDVDRGPDWLFVRPKGLPDDAADALPLAEEVWSLLEQNFTHRLVLELDRLEYLQSELVGQLIWLYKRIHTQGGLMRVCGLSEDNQDVLRQCGLGDRFPVYRDRAEAVMGRRPKQPR